MFETDVDDQPLPCDHPIRWYQRVAAWAHERIEKMTFVDRQKWHDRLPDWVCEAYERIEFDFPCRQCEEDRYREYGATTKTDADVLARFPKFDPDQGSFGFQTNSPDVEPGDPFAYDPDDCPGGCGGQDCCGGHECNGGPDCNLS